MRMLLIVSLLIASAGAAPAASAPACRPLDHCVSACPAHLPHEDGRTYGLRAHDYCRVRWTGLLAARETGGQTHDEFVDGCLRRCVAGTPGAPLGWILGGGTLAAALYGTMSGGGAKSPPASP